MPLSPYAPPDLSSPTYRDQLDYIVCEDGRAIGRMYDDRRRREQRSPTAWSATSTPDPSPNKFSRLRSCLWRELQQALPRTNGPLLLMVTVAPVR